jgi:hypothetical protein
MLPPASSSIRRVSTFSIPHLLTRPVQPAASATNPTRPAASANPPGAGAGLALEQEQEQEQGAAVYPPGLVT